MAALVLEQQYSPRPSMPDGMSVTSFGTLSADDLKLQLYDQLKGSGALSALKVRTAGLPRGVYIAPILPNSLPGYFCAWCRASCGLMYSVGCKMDQLKRQQGRASVQSLSGTVLLRACSLSTSMYMHTGIQHQSLGLKLAWASQRLSPPQISTRS